MPKLTRVTSTLSIAKGLLAGAVDRILQDKLYDTVNVRDYGKNDDLVKNISGVLGRDGSTLKLSGFHSKGDGGGGEFYWDSTLPKTMHNGATHIDPSKLFPLDWSVAGQRNEWFNNTQDGTGLWVRTDTDKLSLKWFGAIGNGSFDNKESINKFIDVWIRGKVAGYIPAGVYFTTDRVLIPVHMNPERICPELYGDGCYTSNIHSTTTVEPVFHIYGSSAGPDHFQGKFSRVGFTCDVPGIGMSIGLGDFSDNHGNYTMEQCFVANFNSTSSPVAISLQLNWLFDCHFENTVVVGKPNFGTALQMRMCHFCHFSGGSYSNARNGVLIDGFSYNVTFDTPDLENINFAFYIDNNAAEYIVVNNPYMDIWQPTSMTYPANSYPIYVGVINAGGLTVTTPRCGRTQSEMYPNAGFISPSSLAWNSIFIKGRLRGQVSPAMPASDASYTNKTGQVQRIRIQGSVTTVFVNGGDTGTGVGEYILNPGEFIAVRYSGTTPTWYWTALV